MKIRPRKNFGLYLLTAVLFITIFSISIVSARDLNQNLRINHIRIGDYGFIYPYDDFGLVVVDVSNLGKSDVENLQIKILIDELNIEGISRSFDLEDRNDNRRAVASFINIPPLTPPGDYLARISVENDDGISKVRYRLITVL